MAGFTTHYLFGVSVYKKLAPGPVKNSIKTYRKAYALGLQGPDIFFFHLPCLAGIHAGNLGSIMHSNHVSTFFANYLDFMEHLPVSRQNIALSYLCGYICHYILDTKVHPYIYSVTAKDIYPVDKIFKKDSSVLPSVRDQYYSCHRSFETQIDTLMFEREKPGLKYDLDKSRTIRLTTEESKCLSSLLSHIINQTKYPQTAFGKKGQITISPIFMRTVFLSLRAETKLLRGNKPELQKKIAAIEKRILGYSLLSSLIPESQTAITDDILNLSHNPWSLPWNKTCISTLSFLDLYNDAAARCIDLFNYYMQPPITKEKKEVLLNELGSRSYQTGNELP